MAISSISKLRTGEVLKHLGEFTWVLTNPHQCLWDGDTRYQVISKHPQPGCHGFPFHENTAGSCCTQPAPGGARGFFLPRYLTPGLTSYTWTAFCLCLPGGLGAIPACGPGGRCVWAALGTPTSHPVPAPARPNTLGRPSRPEATGEYCSPAGHREDGTSLYSEGTSPLFSGTYVSIKETGVYQAIKNLKQNTSSARGCLQPEFPILLLQSRKEGVYDVGPKVWPRSFLLLLLSLFPPPSLLRLTFL